jgi:hypothetical protein
MKTRTFISGDPAANFSKNTGIANAPKAAVALRQPLPRLNRRSLSVEDNAYLRLALKSSAVMLKVPEGGGLNVIGK